MRRKALYILIAAAPAACSAAQSAEPAGPSEWTARNWIGLFVQVSLFILALIGLCRLAGGGGE